MTGKADTASIIVAAVCAMFVALGVRLDSDTFLTIGLVLAVGGILLLDLGG